MNNRKRENRITLILFVITMVVATAPLISRYCINGHDLDYHLLRIESLKEGILIGRPFLKVNTLFFGDAGYASSMFYSDLFMHIPALLRVCHVSIAKSFHIYTAMIFILTYISTFYCVWRMSRSKFAGTAAAVLLTLCPYHMDDMLVRTACGEYTAFMFIPFAIYGIYNVVFEEMDKPYLLGFAFAALAVVHPATCVMTACLCIAVFAVYIKRFIKNPRLIVKVCVVILLAALVSSYQWLPMMEQFASARFYVSDNWTDLLDSAVPFSQLASSTFPCVGTVLFALIVPRFFLSKKEHPILGFTDLLTALAIILAVGATNIMPWERVARFFGFLQFPWRLFILTSTLLAVTDAIVLKLFVDRFGEEQRILAADIALIVLTVISSGLAITHHNENSMGYYDYSDDFFSYKPYTENVVAGEWLPFEVKDPKALVGQSDTMLFDDASNCDFTRHRGKVTAQITGRHEYVDVPFVYYKGYSATIKDSSGNITELSVSGEGENGLCRVELGQATGELTVNYTGTMLQHISLIVSALFLILIFDLVYLKNKYKKKLKLRARVAGANLGKIACILICMIPAVFLSACGTYSVQSSDLYSDPDAVIDYLKDKNGQEDAPEVVEGNLTQVNLSRKGYDSSDHGYAVLIDESTGEQVISVIPVEEARTYTDEEISVTDGLYDRLLSDKVSSVSGKYRTDGLDDRIMNETDALLCMEFFPETAAKKDVDKLAVQMADDILTIPQEKVSDVLDRYNCAAVLAKAAYVIKDWGKTQEAQTLAEQYFKEAETMSDADDEKPGPRLWSAAELYRLTGQKTYRSVVDAIAMDIIPEGFSYGEPGYFGVFAYLMSPYPVNYSVSSGMMENVFSKANALIKDPIDVEFYDTRLDDDTTVRDGETAIRLLEGSYLVTMADYISVSVEYLDYVRSRLNYIYGANLSGVDFTEDDNILSEAPQLFILSGLQNTQEGI
ncbi:MAG: hypothetical protein K6E49_09395 [Lachnospiraceae bacterium]|nr:hypothetical protein [Lachnospiraceae bacterium]